MEQNKRFFDKDTENCIGDALFELKKLQDFLFETSTPFIGKILGKLAGIDTIPFMLLTNKGIFELSGMVRNEKTDRLEYFTTNFFRINSIEKGSTCANVTLLRPFNIEKKSPKSLCEVVRLEKTSVCVDIDLSCICGLQISDVDLLKREIIIEPKW